MRNIKPIVLFLCISFLVNLPSYGQNPCDITVTAEVIDCNQLQGTFFAEVTVTGTGTASSFVLGGNGTTYGSFNYADGPIILGPFVNNGTIYEFAAIDNTMITCFASDNIEPYTTCFTPCLIEVSNLEFQNCGGQEVYLDFQVSHGINIGNSFTASIGNVVYGTFLYDQPYYTIGPLQGDCTGDINLGIFDPLLPGCVDFEFAFGPYCCTNNCEFNDLEITTICDGSEIFGFSYDFNYNGSSQEFFYVLFDGSVIDTLRPSQLPDTILYSFVGAVPDSLSQSFGIQHSSLAGCGFMEEFTITCDTIPPCAFTDISVTPLECDGDNSYLISLNFTAESTSSNFFDVYSQGNYIGVYPYALLPVTIADFPGRDVPFDIIEICDNGSTTCCTVYEFVGLECELECMVSNVFAEAQECLDDGTFYVDIEFDVENPPNNIFEIRGNGTSYGNFEFGDDFYTIGPLIGDCQTIYEFGIFPNDAENCQTFNVFAEPVCCEIAACEIVDIAVTEAECVTGFLQFVLNFFPSDFENTSFDLFVGNGTTDFFGLYAVDDLPVAIDDFPTQANGQYVLTICENDNPDCCSAFEFNGPNCEGSECDIWDLFAESYDCDDDNNFFIDFEFAFANTSDDGFNVLVNGDFVESFLYGEDFYTVGPFDGSCDLEYEIQITDIGDNECSTDFYVGFACCEEECEIAINLMELICLNEEEYQLLIDLETVGINNEFFDVLASSELLGTYSFDDLPLSLNFPISGNTNEVITICENDNDACCGILEFESIECTPIGDCGIFEPSSEAYQCDDNGEFLVDIGFEYVDVSDQGFTIQGNGQNYGSFEYGEDIYTIGPLAGDCETLYEFIITDNGDPTCTNETFFTEVICCESECFIDELQTEIISCDEDSQQFFVTLTFEFGSMNSGLFTISGNGQEYGIFGYGANNYTIGPLTGGDGTSFEFIITDNEDGDCQAVLEYGPVDCTMVDLTETLETNLDLFYNGGIILIEGDALAQSSELYIFDLSGKKILQYPLQNIQRQSIPWVAPSNGIYFMTIKSTENLRTWKIPVLK